MSSNVCQGLQTCLEPRLVEPRVLRLKLAPPLKPINTADAAAATAAATESSISNDMGGWSFLLSLDATNSQANKAAVTDRDDVYVHPLAKSSASKLSAESLAMCTESLGSETGSESGDDISLLSSESSANFQPPSLFRSRSNQMSKKQSRGDVSFPPPLTSISGSGGVQVRPHREAGRLVLKAVNVSPSNTNFQAERCNGRLRLRLLTESSGDQETGEVAEQETGEEDQETEYSVKETEDDEIESENGEEEDGYWGGDMERNYGNVGGEIGIEKFQRPRSRCKEGGGHGNNGLLNENWESHFGWLVKPIGLS